MDRATNGPANGLAGKRIGVVGAGNMAEALIKGLLASGSVRAPDIVASARRSERTARIAERYGICPAADNQSCVERADIVILAVKPQVLTNVLKTLGERIPSEALVVSVAAGVTTATIEGYLRPGTRVIRAMPNTAAKVGRSATAIAPGAHASEADLAVARAIFEAVGRVVVVDEVHLDAVTGLSGSGPAYIFLIIEALSDAGVKVGLSREVALELAAQTLLGSAHMLLETGEHPGALKDQVTSPGGTAIAGLHTLEAGGLRTTLIERQSKRRRDGRANLETRRSSAWRHGKALRFRRNGDGWRLSLVQNWRGDRLDARRNPVLIVPGYGMNSFIFGFHPRGLSLAGYLVEAGFEVWRVDMRQQGESIREGGSDNYGLEDLALTDLRTAIDTVLEHTQQAQASRVDVLGASLGATIMFILATMGDAAKLGSLISIGGPVRWVKVHPVLKIAFGSPRIAGWIRLRGTRRLAEIALPLFARHAPWVLSIYLNPAITDVSAARELVKTVEDPNRFVNRQIAHWIADRDLIVRGTNLSTALARITQPLMCVVANADGIVPQAHCGVSVPSRRLDGKGAAPGGRA